MRTRNAIIVGRFQPLTLGHFRCIEAAQRRGLKPVLCMINTPENKTDERKPFPSSVLMKLYGPIAHKLGFEVVLVKSADIVEISKSVNKIAAWYCGTDRFNDYKRMADKYHDEAKLEDDFEVIEIPRTDEDVSATACREAIKNDDYKKFSDLFIFPSKQVYNTLKEYIHA